MNDWQFSEGSRPPMMSLAMTGVIASQDLENPRSSSAPSALPPNQAATRPFGVPTRIKAWTEAAGDC
jgi:hypothetical protein